MVRLLQVGIDMALLASPNCSVLFCSDELLLFCDRTFKSKLICLCFRAVLNNDGTPEYDQIVDR